MIKTLPILCLMAVLAIGAPTSNIQADTEARSIVSDVFGDSHIGSFITGFGRVSSSNNEAGPADSTTAATAVGLSASVGFSGGIASALSLAFSGAAAGSCDSADKAALSAWLDAAGSVSIYGSALTELQTWCSGDDSVVLSAGAISLLGGCLEVDASVVAAGGIIAFLDGWIGGFVGIGSSLVVLGAADQLALSLYISVEAIFGVEVDGALKIAVAGGIAASLSASAQLSLSAFLSGSSNTLTPALTASVQAWLSGSAGVSAGVHPEIIVAISPSVVVSLQGFIDEAVFFSLSTNVQLGLTAAVAGQAFSYLGADIQSDLSAFLIETTCPLGSDLIIALTSWTSGVLSPDCVAATTTVSGNTKTTCSVGLPTSTTISESSSVSAGQYTSAWIATTTPTPASIASTWVPTPTALSTWVPSPVSSPCSTEVASSTSDSWSTPWSTEVASTSGSSSTPCSTGAATPTSTIIASVSTELVAQISAAVVVSTGFLSASAQTSLHKFLASDAAADLSVTLIDVLDVCSVGNTAVSVEASAATALAAYLASPTCAIEVGLRGGIILWLNLGVTGSGAAGVGVDAGAGLILTATVIADLQVDFALAVFSGDLDLAILDAIGGETAESLTIGEASELIGFLIGGEAINVGFSADVQVELINWVAGC